MGKDKSMKQCPKCRKMHKEKTTFCLECLKDGVSELFVETINYEEYENKKVFSQ